MQRTERHTDILLIDETGAPLPAGSELTTHAEGDCGAAFCAIHRPSDNPLRDSKLVWRGDAPQPYLERICSHGIGHPDVDSLTFISNLGSSGVRAVDHILAGHGCDGCCTAFDVQ